MNNKNGGGQTPEFSKYIPNTGNTYTTKDWIEQPWKPIDKDTARIVLQILLGIFDEMEQCGWDLNRLGADDNEEHDQ